MKYIRMKVNNGFMLSLEKLITNLTHGVGTILEAVSSSVAETLSSFVLK
jgi:hypothetical protein